MQLRHAVVRREDERQEQVMIHAGCQLEFATTPPWVGVASGPDRPPCVATWDFVKVFWELQLAEAQETESEVYTSYAEHWLREACRAYT